MSSQRSSDGSLSQEEESGFGKVGELQEVLDRQTADLGQMKERMVAMASRINELEEDLDTARKDVIKSEDTNTRLQRDLREVSGAARPQQNLLVALRALIRCLSGSPWLRRRTWRRGSPPWRSATSPLSGRPRPSTT